MEPPHPPHETDELSARPLRVAVTGGSGAIGGFILRELRQHSCTVTNFDRVKSPEPDLPTVQLETTNLDDVMSGLQGFDGIVHLAGVSRPGLVANNRMFTVNTQSTFNILEAASVLGINRVVVASSLNAVGMTFNLVPRFDYLPLDEAHPCRPDEPYGLSKQIGEIIADSFARRFPDLTIASLRLPAVMTPAAYRKWDPGKSWLPGALWAYADFRDTARAVRLALRAGWKGHEVFLIAADDTLSEVPSRELAAQHYPGVEIRTGLEGRESLVSAAKARRLLGWRHERAFAAGLREFPPNADTSKI